MKNQTQQKVLQLAIITVWQGVIGCIIGLISGAATAWLVGLVWTIVTSSSTDSLSLLILFGGVVGVPVGSITGILSALADGNLYAGLEWAIIGTLAALGIVLIQGIGQSELVGVIMLIALCAIPSAVVAWLIGRHLSDTVQRRHVTPRTIVLYIVGILLITGVVYEILESIVPLSD